MALHMVEECIDLPRTVAFYSVLHRRTLHQVTIAPQNYVCTCSSRRRNSTGHCPHVAFVLLEVLGWNAPPPPPPPPDPTPPPSDPSASLPSNRGVSSDLPTCRWLRAKFKTRLKAQSLPKPLPGSIPPKPLAGNDCAICLEPLLPRQRLVCCRSTCGNHFHAACMDGWLNRRSSASCPYCRSTWIT